MFSYVICVGVALRVGVVGCIKIARLLPLFEE